VALGLTGRYVRGQATHRVAVLCHGVKILINLQVGSVRVRSDLPGNHRVGRSLFQQALFQDGEGAVRTALARIDFQLGTNSGKTTVKDGVLARDDGFSFAEPASISCFQGSVKGHCRGDNVANVPNSCNELPFIGALVHTWGSRCYSPATPPDRAANDLTENLSQ